MNIKKEQIILNRHIFLGVNPIPEISMPEKIKENLEVINFSTNKKYVGSLFKFGDKQHRFSSCLKNFCN